MRRIILLLTITACCGLAALRPAGGDQVTPAATVETHLNVRSSPSTGGQIVATLSPGEKAELLRTSGEWHEIRLLNGTTGFVSRSWTVVVEEAPLPSPAVKDTVRVVRDTVEARRLQALSDSIRILSHEIDSLNAHIGTLRPSSPSENPFSMNTILLIIAIIAAIGATVMHFLPRRGRPLPVKKETPVEEPVEAPKEDRTSRKSFFVVSSPRIIQTRDTYCSLHLSFINSGDHPATSFQAFVFMIEPTVSDASIDREFRFSTANPVGSKNDISFVEEDIDFTAECSPKFICVAIEYVDYELKKRCKQEFTFLWEGVRQGVVSEDCRHVEKEKSEAVWLRLRQLRWERGSRLRRTDSS